MMMLFRSDVEVDVICVEAWLACDRRILLLSTIERLINDHDGQQKCAQRRNLSKSARDLGFHLRHISLEVVLWC